MSWIKPKTLSVVINTCNRAESLDKTIQSLLQQAANNIEIVAVNGPSTDHTNEILSKYKGRIKIHQCSNFNLSISRNIGIAASSGDVIAFIDDDAFPEPYWAKRLLDAYTCDDIGGVGGFVFDQTGVDYQTKYILCDRYGSAWSKESSNPSDLYSFPHAFKFSALIGTNCSFRRDLLLSIGGFDEEYEYFLDETDVCVRIIDRGYKIVQIENAYVHHKFLPSHMRTAKKATVHHYPILKNSLYFALKYASPYFGVDAALQHGENVFQAHLRDARWFVEHGQLDTEKLTNLPDVYAKAKQRALDCYQQGTKRYLGESLLAENKSEFLPCVAEESVGSTLCVVLMCRQYDVVDSGIARFVQTQARALASLGHTVHVLTLVQQNPTIDWENGVWVHRLTAGWYDDQPTSLTFKVHPSQWCYSRAMLDEIRNINRRHKVDIVEAPIWDNEAIALVCAKEFPTVVSLQTTLGIALETHPEWRNNEKHMSEFVLPAIEAENFILNNCDTIRGISRAIVSEIEFKNGISISSERTEICSLALEDRASDYIEKRTETLDVFFLGRLELRKGIDILLESIPAVLEAVPQAHFIIAGDDTIFAPDSTETFRQIFEKNNPELADQVTFLGKISDKEVDGYFRSSALFVAPSRFESFGLIYVEAMMFGVPSIGCDVGGIPEVLGQSGCGSLIEVGNAAKLASEIIRMLINSELRIRLGQHGRHSYENRFTPNVICTNLVALYGRAIDRAASRISGKFNSEIKENILSE